MYVSMYHAVLKLNVLISISLLLAENDKRIDLYKVGEIVMTSLYFILRVDLF